jgi:hypothetical protein
MEPLDRNVAKLGASNSKSFQIKFHSSTTWSLSQKMISNMWSMEKSTRKIGTQMKKKP